MIGWSGRRKTLTILLFIAPTLLGILVFSIYPLLLNVFISLTDRGKFHPNPDCADGLWRIVEPTCWLGSAPRGIAEPFGFRDPILQNYSDLLGGFFTQEALLALLKLVILALPLVAAAYVNRRLDRQRTRTIPSNAVWLTALVVVVGLAWLVNVPEAYSTLLESGDFIMVNVRTILYVVVVMPLVFSMGLVMAIILNNEHLRGLPIFRVILIVPWAASNVAIMMTLVWQFFFRQNGTINQIVAALIQDFDGPAYLNSGTWAFVVVVLIQLWYTYPFFMVTLLGGLQSIPTELYEAAEVDGASWWRQLVSITLPLLRPVAMPVIVLSSLTTYKISDVVWAATKGGPIAGAGKPGATEFVMVHAYKQIFQTQAFGRMGAFAVILFAALFAATLYSLRLTEITKGAYE